MMRVANQAWHFTMPLRGVSSGHPYPVRGAFSLIELLVVTCIIALLMALLLPAIQAAREAVHRSECGNGLKQLGLAMQMHHDVYRYLPHNGGWDGKQVIPDASGMPFTPSTNDYAAGRTFHWGAADPTRGTSVQTGSWVYSVLPYLEQTPLFDVPRWDATVPVLTCPSRRANEPSLIEPKDEYGEYESGGWKWGKSDYAANSRLVPGRPAAANLRNVRFSKALDGFSNTLLVGEKAFDPAVSGGPTWYWDEPFMLGGSGGTVRDGIGLQFDRPGIEYKRNWGSAHRAGVQFGFCDGSVQVVTYETDWAIIWAFVTPDGGEIPSAP